MKPNRNALGLWTLVALVIANMIGAGVFTTSGFALADLGSPLRVLAAWLIGGLLALCGALSYGALARLIPESGGEYLYLSRVIHPSAGFMAGWISLLAGFTGSIAYAALTFAAYAVPTGTATPLMSNLIATAAIGVTVLLHALRVRQGAWVQNAAVAVKVALMLSFCLFAVLGPGVGRWAGLSELANASYTIPPFSAPAFALSLMWISFSYLGFNAAVYLAGEVPSASHQVPRALVIGTALTVVIYMILNAVFVLTPAFADVAGQEDIAAIAARSVGGEVMEAAVRAVVALALFTSVSAMVMVGPRVYAKMADDGLFPTLFRFGGETPTAAIVLQGTLATAVVWLAGLRELLSYLGFTLGLSTAATIAALFVAVRHRPDEGRRLPGYPWAPATFIVFTLLFATLAATVNPVEMLAAIVTIASGFGLWVFVKDRWKIQ